MAQGQLVGRGLHSLHLTIFLWPPPSLFLLLRPTGVDVWSRAIKLTADGEFDGYQRPPGSIESHFDCLFGQLRWMIRRIDFTTHLRLLGNNAASVYRPPIDRLGIPVVTQKEWEENEEVDRSDALPSFIDSFIIQFYFWSFRLATFSPEDVENVLPDAQEDEEDEDKNNVFPPLDQLNAPVAHFWAPIHYSPVQS